MNFDQSQSQQTVLLRFGSQVSILPESFAHLAICDVELRHFLIEATGVCHFVSLRIYQAMFPLHDDPSFRKLAMQTGLLPLS